MKKLIALAAVALALAAQPVSAVTVFNSSVTQWSSTDPTPGSIGGSGQVNGGFVINNSPIELALRASQYGVGPLPGASIVNSTYFVQPGSSPSNVNRAWWSFDVNINLLNDTSGLTLGTITPTLLIDIDPTAGQNFLAIPLTSSLNYNPANRLFQESFNIGFASLASFIDRNVDGEYDFLLSVVIPGGPTTQSVGMKVVVGDGADPVVPEPATLTLIGMGASGLAMLRRRRK